jgi:hypothetical protein
MHSEDCIVASAIAIVCSVNGVHIGVFYSLTSEIVENIAIAVEGGFDYGGHLT